ncbi:MULTISPECIES: ABC transporter permease [unclassified Frankia]|uniref:ABC transporter permease n=1 Tax=unclassified Frankia TaxID=2632575 RepID=UPI002AD492D7|nr:MULTISPECIES: ABC transporter permease [unclassified Frankia]
MTAPTAASQSAGPPSVGQEGAGQDGAAQDAGTVSAATIVGGAVALPPNTRFGAALRAVYVGQLSRARVARVPLLFVAAFQSLGIMLLLRGVVDTGNETTSEQVVAGSTVLVVAFIALNLLAQRFGALRAAGALDYYLTLPIPASAVVLGTAASYASFAVPGTVITAVVGALLYGLPLSGLWLLLPVVALAGASLAGIGAAIGLLAPRQELATVVGQVGMSVVLFVGIIPADRLPAGVKLLRDLVPSTYAVDVLAAAFRPSIDWAAAVVDLLVCAVVAVIMLTAASMALRRAGNARR